MRVSGRQWQYLILGLLVILSIMPTVYAYARTGVSPLDSAIGTISNLFNIQILKNNAYVREGFMRLMIFLVLFAVSNSALKKIGKGETFNPKTAGIVSFAFSMIGVFLAPDAWFDATAGLVIAIMSSLIFAGVFLGGAYYAMVKLHGTKDEPAPLKDMLGLILLFLLLAAVGYWAHFTGLPPAPMLLLLRKEWFVRSS